MTFEHAIIASGSRPAAVPGLSIDSPRVMDSTGALDLPDIPNSLLVVGGGYIGLEMGSVYAALGTKVTVVEMTAGLLPGADRDLVTVLNRRIEPLMHRILLNTRVTGMKDVKDGVKVEFAAEGLKDADKSQTFDRVLVSVGRKPNSAVPGLDKIGVALNPRGFIQVDQTLRTTVPNIFAIGDVVGDPMLAHKASHEAGVAVEAILGKKVAFEPQAIPAVVFTDPEIAWCGLTETDAAARAARSRSPSSRGPRSAARSRSTGTDGLTKLVIDPETERVLGVGIAGAGAGELIAEGVLAVEMGALAADVGLTIHPHPTLSETLMEAAEVFYGHSTHVYRPKKKATS